ncbi:MAG: amino acid ABC transporter substrate-binding protein [Cyanobacteriota bacterium]
MPKWSSLLLAALLLVTPLAACRSRSANTSAREGTQAGGVGLLKKVTDRGKLACGVSGNLPGFSYVDQQGKYSGLDVDICRAIATALFDDPEAVEFRNLNAKERFTALQAGEIDILSRNTSWTISRDTSIGLEFAPVVFYDGQGMMVKQASGIKDLKGLEGKSVCIQTGTTTEQNLADQMRKIGVKYTPIVFEDVNATFTAYQEGRCEGVTADRSQLVSRRSILPNPDEHVVLDAVMSKEPLAPAVKNGDSQWFDTVKWVVYGLIEAEELGITSKNIDQFANSTDPVVKRLLGKEGNLGQEMGLPNDFMARVIRKVGNYGEIYERNLGQNTPFKLPRSQNDIWEKGGLMYAPPFR